MNYTSIYYSHLAFRKSCAVCHYTNLQRPSDITLADYWGWERTDLHFNEDDKGVSLVFCNTEKGRELFDAVKDRMETIPVELANSMQNCLERPVNLHPLRDEFEYSYGRYGFLKTLRKFGFLGWRHSLNHLKLVFRVYTNKLKGR